jgi:mannose-6-phosphate isomerase-like protein (cupin superfamily)
MGENHGLHAHFEEEHLFIVLLGEAVFAGIDGPLPALTRNKGIWLPKGCFYEFYNPGPGPLVLIRFGAQATGADAALRLTPDGAPIEGRDAMFRDLAVPEVIGGAFFE